MEVDLKSWSEKKRTEKKRAEQLKNLHRRKKIQVVRTLVH